MSGVTLDDVHRLATYPCPDGGRWLQGLIGLLLVGQDTCLVRVNRETVMAMFDNTVERFASFVRGVNVHDHRRQVAEMV